MKTLSDSEIELIEKYIDNSLSDEETNLFHQKVQQSVEFSDQLELALITIKDIKENYQPFTKKELFEIFEHSKKEIEKNTKIKKLSLIAAGISLVLCSLFALNNDSDNISQTLFMEYYEEYPAHPIFRDLNQKDNLSKAIQAYERGYYQNALPYLLEQFSKESDHNLAIYIGNSFLAQDDINQAIKFFKLAEQSSEEDIRAHAKWYLALSYLKSAKINDSKEVLTDIIDQKQLYFKEAQELLNKMKNHQKTK
ncbi:tetratricopeptide repeat protein [Reichenbachiella sp.]|uniref:tetratricopeptide repeat protein n=1 Tax=Reichenbachiella sp. TaxID=2184521 RepID=UPI003BAF4331